MERWAISGVSVCSLDDAKRLYSGFDLCDPSTSVSMTINGPAPMVLAFFLNAAIDQRCEKHIQEHGLEAKVETLLRSRWEDNGLVRPLYRGDLPEGNDGLGLLLLGCTGDEVLDAETYATLAAEALSQVRGTVQADILKEDQAQNTCIFSTEFALRLMGDVQAYFIDHRRAEFLLRLHFRLSHRRSGCQSHYAIGVHLGQRLHLCGVLSQPWHGHQCFRPQPELLFLQRNRP